MHEMFHVEHFSVSCLPINSRHSPVPDAIQFEGTDTVADRLLTTVCSYDPPVDAVKYR
jgi:hypothetical protein